MITTDRTRERRRRRLYAAIAGWALLGAASTGIVACSTATQAAGTAGSTTASTSGSSAGGSSVTSSAAATRASTASAAAGTTAATAASAAKASAASSTYADGTYTATGSYTSPGGTDTITITLTLDGDVISEASAVGGDTSGPSSKYETEFAANFAGLIVGKDVDSVSLDKVAGSSLTSAGFNAAVQTIKTDARG